VGGLEDPAAPTVRTDKGKGKSYGREAGFRIIQSLPKLLPGASRAAFGGSVIFCCLTSCSGQKAGHHASHDGQGYSFPGQPGGGK